MTDVAQTEASEAPPPAPPRLDLFGDPVPENWGGRGRPAHIATLENQNRVLMGLALGWSNERIASAIGVTPPTLRKNYKAALRLRDEQRDRLKLSQAMTLWRLGQDGNVSALREFDTFLEKNDLMTYGQTSKPTVAAPPKEPKLGKKAAAIEAAKNPDRGTPLGQLMALRKADGDLTN